MVDLCLTRGKFNFEALLDKFPDAKRVIIVTWSIEVREKTEIFKRLRSLKSDCELVIITNVPSRHPKGDYRKNSAHYARGKINQQIQALDPSSMKCEAKVYFTFASHSKIIIVDQQAYIGSANFTNASKRNYEAGVALSGAADLLAIESFVDGIKSDAVPYYKSFGTREGARVLGWVTLLKEVAAIDYEELCVDKEDANESIEFGDEGVLEAEVNGGHILPVGLYEELTDFSTALIEDDWESDAKGVLDRDLIHEVVGLADYIKNEKYIINLKPPVPPEDLIAKVWERGSATETTADGDVVSPADSQAFNAELSEALGNYRENVCRAIRDSFFELQERIESSIVAIRMGLNRSPVSSGIDNTPRVK